MKERAKNSRLGILPKLQHRHTRVRITSPNKAAPQIQRILDSIQITRSPQVVDSTEEGAQVSRVDYVVRCRGVAERVSRLDGALDVDAVGVVRVLIVADLARVVPRSRERAADRASEDGRLVDAEEAKVSRHALRDVESVGGDVASVRAGEEAGGDNVVGPVG